MKRTLPIALTLALVLLGGSVYADLFTFVTPAGSTAGGQPVSATVDITTGDGSITVVLTNLQGDPTSVVQALSDLIITLNNDPGAASLDSSTAEEIEIAADGTFVSNGDVDTGWALSLLGGNTLKLDVLGTLIGPAHTLIGPDDGTGVYTSANASIAGNGPHNPFLLGTATFNILAPGVTVDTEVTGVTFSFGTDEGAEEIPGEPGIPGLPEPATVTLLGTGLLGLASYLHRRRSA